MFIGDLEFGIKTFALFVFMFMVMLLMMSVACYFMPVFFVASVMATSEPHASLNQGTLLRGWLRLFLP